MIFLFKSYKSLKGVTMDNSQKVLLIHAPTAFYRMNRYKVGNYFGPIDLGYHLAAEYNSLNIGVGLLAGSIFPGSNRLMFTGFSPSWGGFYVSSMGGAGLIFDNLGINMLSLVGKAPAPSILFLNRTHGEEVEVGIHPVDVNKIWKSGRKGVYSLMDYTYERFGDRYENEPRIMAVGPSAASTKIGAICSIPISKGKFTDVDTWAGRGGFGSKMYRDHGIVAIIYGGTVLDEDFRDRKVADKWFVDKYQKKLAAKDLEATTKYRFDPKFRTGGTFGVNYQTLAGKMISFNYNSIYMKEEERLDIHKKFVIDHYLKQFNEETIEPKNQKTCGEPCVALCKKMRGKYKKDYEPYQTMGPLSGIFDQRAAEKLNHHADMYGFDGISGGGLVAWIMECLSKGYIKPEEIGVSKKPIFDLTDFDVVNTSKHNAEVGVEILDAIIERRGIIDFSSASPRKIARDLAPTRGQGILDSLVIVGYARDGWMVPNQYWVPGALSPMPIMGKYYMHYKSEFIAPRDLGRKNAERLKGELILDNIGICRFHRNWAEEMMPEVMGSLYDLENQYIDRINKLCHRIGSRNSSTFWESTRNFDFIQNFLIREHDVEGNNSKEILKWIDLFKKDKREAALTYWYETHKGIQETILKM
jgi:glyceraldehyde-3-phosphate dehydrogenase (ferredoxin)